MRKQTNRIFSILLTLVMLLGLLPVSAQAATRPFFSVQPQAGTAVKENGYPIAWKTISQAPVYWMYLDPNSPQWVAGDVLKKNPATLPYNAAHCLDNGTGLYKLVAVANDTQYESDSFQVTWVDGYRVTVNGGSGSGRYLEGDSVTITANAPETGKTFKEWTSEADVTFADATASTTTFTMPAEDMELTATYQRVKPDTTVVRPAGSGTADDPFQISTVGELYWFTGFTNNYVAVGEDFAVERNKAHAILMNDITVNPEMLDSYVLNANSSLLADWTPICGSNDSSYCGTFDGQGYSISGLYYNTPGYQYDAYGFIAYMGEGGAVKDLTVKDTYFYIKYTSHFTPYVAGIAAYSSNATNTIENCHFDGVAGGDSSSKGCVAGGITAVTGGKIQNCTAKGRVLGYDSYVGYGKAGGIAGHAYSTAAISDCINYAEVLCWDSGSAQGTAGGIVGYLYGTVKDCSNRGVINGYDLGNNNNAGGIVGWASGTAEQKAVISRCFNMAYFSGSGIVDYISKGYVEVKNCYNAGSVTIGIAGITNGAGISITYCHDVGYTGKPIGGYSSTDDVEIDHCYYIDRVSYDTDRNPMTDAKLSEEFADGTVLALLDNGHWTQGVDDDYPVLGDPPVSISGKVTVTGTSATASVTVEELSGKAILIIAQYSGDQMKAVQTVSVTADGTVAPDNPFTHAEGCTYKAFLVNADTYAPLCAAAPLSA